MPVDSEIFRMKQQTLGVSTAALAELTGIARDRLSLYLSGTGRLPNNDLIKLDESFKELMGLVDAASPFPLSWKNVALIQELLCRLRQGEFSGRKS
jgi:hypothetical protein